MTKPKTKPTKKVRKYSYLQECDYTPSEQNLLKIRRIKSIEENETVKACLISENDNNTFDIFVPILNEFITDVQIGNEQNQIEIVSLEPLTKNLPTT